MLFLQGVPVKNRTHRRHTQDDRARHVTRKSETSVVASAEFCRALASPRPGVRAVAVCTARRRSPRRAVTAVVIIVRTRLDTDATPTRWTCTRRIGRRPGHVSNCQRAAPGPRRRSFRLAKILRAPRSPSRTRHRTSQ